MDDTPIAVTIAEDAANYIIDKYGAEISYGELMEAVSVLAYNVAKAVGFVMEEDESNALNIIMANLIQLDTLNREESDAESDD